jgi:TolA-binding protein
LAELGCFLQAIGKTPVGAGSAQFVAKTGRRNMNKLVMAALLATASLTGLHGSADAFQLFPTVSLGHKKAPEQPKAEVHLAQATDPTLRVQQLEEELRTLNGRIEEMSFQLLQMQETIRKQQEDNEFRFQDLEKKKTGSLSKPVDGGGGAA